ncbi:MAG TPA: FlgD immunoglobulin-like domain containing protein, partial [Candidatus Eisenbacteria bacterium]|nr:FlgD immunoglobulin-like domain containing protein [Candidatus Eisenbacteria bacterium]
VIGNFEGAEESGANSIDNRDTPFTTALTNWKSTGKPPSIYFHTENLADLTYNDLCGPPNSPARFCNIGGVVVSMGNHDLGEDAGDPRYTSDREIQQLLVSPTINLVADTSVANTPNPQGITTTIKDATNDYWLWYDIYAGSFNLFFTGDVWIIQVQSYPSTQTASGGLSPVPPGEGVKCWGDALAFPGQFFNPEPQCVTDWEQLFGNGLVITSNPSGIPDSLRLEFAINTQCFRFGVSLGCNSNAGGYFDNVSLAFVDIPAASQASASNTIVLGPVTLDIWQFWNDTFPANETAGLPGTAAFDTTAALIKTGLNTAQSTGNELRFDIPGDTTIIKASNATVGSGDDPSYIPVRVDLVFRILPGPGNYQIAAGRSMPPGGVPTGTLLQLPTNQAATVSPGDASFWGQFIANAGEVADNPNSHHGHTSWDPLTWNSARCDSAEFNLFPTGLTFQLGPLTGLWASMYHESDPKFATLGTNKFRCFLVDTTKSASMNPSNVVCDGTVPAWLTIVPHSHTGWDGNNTTKEFTKIIPDGLLTPGSHVEYFYRKSHAVNPFFEFSLCPDTTLITPQNGEGSSDGHRWQQFGVLPDRWKDAAFGGAGMACMLYVDNDDRRGDERVFVSAMDSIGATAAPKFGAHNGWHASGTQNINGIPDPATFVANKNSQPGTTWDMYGVKASESLTTSAGALGSRLANRSNMGLGAGKYSRQGPTPEMLRTYYRVVALLSGDLDSGVLGPFANRSQDDVAILADFLTTAAGSAQPRGILAQGDGFGESENWAAGVDPAHTALLADLGVSFRNLSYQSISGNVNACADLLTTAQVTGRADVYGVQESCSWSNDVYLPDPASPEAVAGSFYENVGPNGPYVAEVLKPPSPNRNWLAFTSGYDIRHLLGRYCDTDMGRLAWYYFMLNQVFGGICALTGTPVVTLDTPGTPRGAPFTDFMKVGNSVMRQGVASVIVSFAKPGFARVGVYDISGRLVRSLAARQFPAGPSTLRWDGSDDGGRRVARGVYFVRTSLTHDTGRIIVLND